jgi:hypothetical protein
MVNFALVGAGIAENEKKSSYCNHGSVNGRNPSAKQRMKRFIPKLM